MRKLCFIFLLGLAACSNRKVPSDIIQPEKMKPLIFDMMRADQFVDSYVLTDTALKSKEQHIKLYEQVFLIHKTNRDQFYKSLSYYQQHPKINKVLFDSLMSYSTRQREILFRDKYQKPAK